MSHPLDNAAWHALTGPHACFAQEHGRARRYHPDFARYSALPDERGAPAWRDLAVLSGPGAEVILTGAPVEPPTGWSVIRLGRAVQMVADHVRGEPGQEVVRLGPTDVPEITGLIARTRPGPWRPRTIELGAYHGIRHGGRLVAMAGERVQPPGWTEVSAVCTDPSVRGQGLAGRLVAAVVHGIHARGDQALLHAAVTNEPAIRVYHRLGFRFRRETAFMAYRTPEDPSGGSARCSRSLDPVYTAR